MAASSTTDEDEERILAARGSDHGGPGRHDAPVPGGSRTGAVRRDLRGRNLLDLPDFDIAPDGKSFVMVKPDEEYGKATEIRLVLNWFEELKRIAPAGGSR